MTEKSSPLSMFLYIFSILYGGFGVVVGIVFLFNSVGTAIMIIMISVVGGVLTFSMGKAVQLLSNLKVTDFKAPSPSKAPEMPVEQEDDNDRANTAESESVYSDWSVSEKDRRAIIEHYGKSGSKVEDIIPVPLKYYCVVKAEDFIDVIELVNGVPQTLSREDVEQHPLLRDWIEENLFGQNE